MVSPSMFNTHNNNNNNSRGTWWHTLIISPKQKSSVQTIKADFLKVVKINADLTFN